MHPKGGLLFARLELALKADAIHNALDANTWGAFRARMPRDEYLSLLELWREFEDPDDDPYVEPADHQEFSADYVLRFSDGDYPEWLQAVVDSILPHEVLERYGERESTFCNGCYWNLYPSHARDIVAALEERGYEVEERRDLKF